MTVRICQECNQAYSVDATVDDYVHACSSGSDALDNEDVVVSGSWEDFTGSATVTGDVGVQGAANKLQGTRADIEDGENLDSVTRRGNRVATHRQRQRLVYKKFKSDVEQAKDGLCADPWRGKFTC